MSVYQGACTHTASTVAADKHAVQPYQMSLPVMRYPMGPRVSPSKITVRGRRKSVFSSESPVNRRNPNARR